MPLFCLLAITACGKAKDVDKVADAQSCLDTATSSQAAECVSKVDGINAEAADLIRCAGKFVKEGYNENNKVANAVSQISNNKGSNGSTAMMAALAFKAEATTAANSLSAQSAFTYCSRSKSKGLILLSGMVQTSTVLAELGGGNLATLDGPALLALMTAQANNPAAQAAVGSAIVGIYSSNCTGGQTASGNFCAQFNSAIGAVSGGTSNVNGVGQRVMFCYTNPTDPTCIGFAN